MNPIEVAMDPLAITKSTLLDFATRFVAHPYLAYTEHGLHALFLSELLTKLSPEERFTDYEGHRICVVQKEYPTAHNLGKSRRQGWDIAVLKQPPTSLRPGKPHAIDYLRLHAVIEFGLNEDPKHIADDLARVTHPMANIENAFVAHFYRLSRPGAPVSARDWSPRSRRILTPDDILDGIADRKVEVVYSLADETSRIRGGAWWIGHGRVEAVRREGRRSCAT